MTEEWYYEEIETEEQDEYVYGEYEITSSPNDFNILTLYNFLESGVVKIPSFQRNFVWDINRASKLIESLIIGLPIPQIFLYEESRNKFLIIDGQQRLMSIYYFIKQRFPKKEKRTEIGNIFDTYGRIPEEVLNDNQYFRPFRLNLSSPGKVNNKLHGLTYETLGDFKTNFDLRTVRNIIIKQNQPVGVDSSMYEIFNRLNSGGLNLKPQEIRSSLHHSKFDDMLKRINLDTRWRRLIGQPNPDLRLKDIEILLRGFAMLHMADSYKAPMAHFLNSFAFKAQSLSNVEVAYLENLFFSFLENCRDLNPSLLCNKSGKFNVLIFESVFSQICKPYFEKGLLVDTVINNELIQKLIQEPDFMRASSAATANRDNVMLRLKTAKSILLHS